MKKAEMQTRIKEGTLVPFIGMGVFKEVKCDDGTQIPYDSDSMIFEPQWRTCHVSKAYV